MDAKTIIAIVLVVFIVGAAVYSTWSCFCKASTNRG